MMQNDLISIIIPVYNAEKYLRRCVESVIFQTYRNIEIIFVDNSSKDNTVDIIESYKKNNSRIKLIQHKENLGLMQSRISGVKASSGKYIQFVDADDYISCDWVRMMHHSAKENGADIVLGDLILEMDGDKKYMYSLDPIRLQNILLEGEDIFRNFMEQKGTFYGWHTMWNKMCSRDVWLKTISEYEDYVKENNIVMTEDIAFSSSLYSNAKKMCNIHNCYYVYCKTSESSTMNENQLDKFLKSLSDVKKTFYLFDKNVKKYGNTYEKLFKEWKKEYGGVYLNNLKRVNCTYEVHHTLSKEIEEYFEISHDAINNKNLFYEELTEVTPVYNWYEMIKLSFLDPNTECVSFDIFDTLILRPFYYPSDLFYLLNEKFYSYFGCKSCIQFSKIRVDAEKNIRDYKKIMGDPAQDVTLDEIYTQIEKDYGFNKNLLEKLKQYEIDLELKYIVERKTGKELFELSKHLGKKIILVSDMYLDLDTIKKILEKNGYDGYHKIYLSSVIKLTKHTGDLYDYVKKDLGYVKDPSKICHIGDNWYSDVQMAQKKGLISHHLAKVTDLLESKNPGTYTGNLFNKVMQPPSIFMDVQRNFENNIGIRCLWALIANKMFDNPYIIFKNNTDFNESPLFLGYCAVGLHIFAITHWIRKKISKDCNTIHFVARDGYLIKRAMDIFNSKYGGPNTNYLRISRQSSIVMDINCIEDLYSLQDKINVENISRIDTIIMIKDLFSETKLDTVVKNIKEKYTNYDVKFKSKKEFIRFIKEITCNYKQYFDFEHKNCIYKEYFKKIIHPSDVLFDIGYSGRAEYSISTVLGYPINSFYIHTNSDIAYQRANILNNKIYEFYRYKPEITGVIREHIFSEQAPSTKGYIFTKNGVNIIFDENYVEDYVSSKIVALVQKYALEFCTDALTHFGDSSLLNYVKYDDLSVPFEYYLHASQYGDRMIFKNLTFEDKLSEGGEFNAVDFWTENVNHVISKKYKDDIRSIERNTPINLDLNTQILNYIDCNHGAVIKWTYKQIYSIYCKLNRFTHRKD